MSIENKQGSRIIGDIERLGKVLEEKLDLYQTINSKHIWENGKNAGRDSETIINTLTTINQRIVNLEANVDNKLETITSVSTTVNRRLVHMEEQLIPQIVLTNTKLGYLHDKINRIEAELCPREMENGEVGQMEITTNQLLTKLLFKLDDLDHRMIKLEMQL